MGQTRVGVERGGCRTSKVCKRGDVPFPVRRESCPRFEEEGIAVTARVLRDSLGASCLAWPGAALESCSWAVGVNPSGSVTFLLRPHGPHGPRPHPSPDLSPTSVHHHIQLQAQITYSLNSH